jgi:hypothetical protein
MFPLSLVLGSTGALLIVVGAVGGGFTFSGLVVPAVGAAGRILSFAVGALLVVVGLIVFVMDPAIQLPADASTPDPRPTAAAGPNGSAPGFGPVDQQVVYLLSQRPSFAGVSGVDLVSLAHAECGVLQRGGTGSDVVTIATDNGVSYADAVYELQLSVEAYCGDLADAASQ